ncbi:MAG: hypothetical protein GY851_35940 [bacterium]|nr:hypothetical protein [bacterium]
MDFQPIHIKDFQLNGMFTDKKRNFITYFDPRTDDIGNTMDNNRKMVRINAKFDPIDTRIKYPPSMKGWKKTSIARTKNDERWKCI